MKFWTIAGVAIFAANAAIGQTWQSRALDSGALYYGSAYAPTNSMSVRCTAPSPQGLELIATGDHESNRTDTPFTMIVTLSIDVIDPFNVAHTQTGARIILDNVPYPIALFEYSDFYGEWTAGPFSMGDRLFSAMAGASEMLLDTGLGTAYAYPVDGLSAALDQAMDQCISGWVAQGHTVPAGLSRDVAQGAGAPGAVLPPAAMGRLNARCLSGTATIDPAAIEAADIDGDGIDDYIFHYGGLDCGDGMYGGGYCGAANCSIDVFLSTLNHGLSEEFLGTDLSPVEAPDGAIGLQLSGTFSLCGAESCGPPFFWTGSEFVQ